MEGEYNIFLKQECSPFLSQYQGVSPFLSNDQVHVVLGYALISLGWINQCWEKNTHFAHSRTSVFKTRYKRRILADPAVKGVFSANYLHNPIRAVLLQLSVLWNLISTGTFPEVHCGGRWRCSDGRCTQLGIYTERARWDIIEGAVTTAGGRSQWQMWVFQEQNKIPEAGHWDIRGQRGPWQGKSCESYKEAQKCQRGEMIPGDGKSSWEVLASFGWQNTSLQRPAEEIKHVGLGAEATADHW